MATRVRPERPSGLQAHSWEMTDVNGVTVSPVTLIGQRAAWWAATWVAESLVWYTATLSMPPTKFPLVG